MANLRNDSLYLIAHGDGANVLVGYCGLPKSPGNAYNRPLKRQSAKPAWDHIEQHGTHTPIIVNIKIVAKCTLPEFDHSIDCSS